MINFFYLLKSNYDNLKIHTKFILIILVTVMLPIIFIGTTYSDKFYNMILSDTLRMEQISSAQVAPQINSTLLAITDTYNKLKEHPYYKLLFNQPINSSLKEVAKKPIAHDFSSYITSLTSDSLMTSVRFYIDIPSDDPFFKESTSQNLFLPISSAKGTYWYGIFQGNPINTSLYCPSFYLGPTELKTLGNSAYITYTTLYYLGNAYPCYIALYYSNSIIETLLKESAAPYNGISYIINDRNALIACSNQRLAGIYSFSYSDIQDALLSSNNFIEREVLGETVHVGFYYLKIPKWVIVTVLPQKALIQKGNKAILQILMYFITCIAFALMIALWQCNSITKRISSVIHQMTQLQKGTPVAMPSPHIQDEVGELITTYNHMTQKMNLLIEKQIRISDELRISEFNSLQAQINPHFLYNTMDMIHWMAVQGQTDEISSVVQDLAQFYRLTLSKNNSFNTVEEEIKHITLYVKLQNRRFKDSISLIIDLPDELNDCSLPKLSLQPIIENSILHGILEKPSKSGSIVITGWIQNKDAILLISDNGIGIPADKLQGLLTNIQPSSSSSIAIYNTHRRFQLLYGPSYGLTYSSITGKGTEVKINIPLKYIH